MTPKRGQAMVEFALLAPIAFLLLLSILVTAIIVTNYIQLSNEARDGARVAAICGSDPGTLMPDGSGLCTGANVDAYITEHLVALPAGSVQPQIHFCSLAQVQNGTCAGSSDPCTTSGTSFCQCQPGSIFEVDMSYDQPLYFPLLSNLFETNSNGTRRLTASAQATCEK